MEELRQITEHLLQFSPDALIVVDDADRIRFANETVAQLFGHRPENLIGKPLDTLIPERLRAHHGKHTASYARNPNNREMGARIADLFAVRADGSEFPAGIRLAPFRIDGKLFVAAAIRDTTERRIINDELVAAQQEAERANRAKSRFLATASHDLRQPMQTVRLLNAAMMKIVPQVEARELLYQQSQAIESMTRLLNALLDISRLESGAIEPVNVDVPLAQVFEELRSEFSSVAASRNVDLQVELPPFVLSTDRTLLYQLLQNLLGNALKYTDRGWVRLKCSHDSNDIIIAVADSGIGIPADKLERIFDEYYQVDTHGAKRMGVGLGLAIVKEVARLLGFSVKIFSKVGEGTQVVLHIPRRYAVTRAATKVEPVPVPALDPHARKARLILVEDNDGVRIATELYLKLEGYETRSAATLAEAEVLLERLQPGDIVIADYHLDEKNTGLDMLMRLRERLGYDVPGVVLSGDLPSVLRSLRAPVPSCRFLSKPVDTVALVQAIAELSAVSRDQTRGVA
ncbi:MAG TPA: ATP-binding protein [Steroidobacteraceae bacterium]|jgi:PAS domain S-box-containing protein|nr:ATP-binding protein [Steroidobacteraceae bacterium]